MNQSIKKIFINSASGIIQNLLYMLIVGVSISILIKQIGSEKFGLFSALTIIGNLNVLANLGFYTSLLKFLSEQGEIIESYHDIRISFIFIVSISLIMLLFGIALKKIIVVNILNIPSIYVSDSENIIIYLFLANVLLLTSQILYAMIEAKGKIYLTNSLQVIYTLLYWSSIIFSLVYLKNLKMLGVSIFTSTLIWFIIVLTNAFHNWDFKKLIYIKELPIKNIKKIFSYSGKIYFNGILGFLFEPLTKILISHFIGLDAVGFYNIAIKIKGILFSFISKIYQPLLPKISEITDLGKVKSYITDISQKSIFLIIPFSIFIYFFIGPIINLWIGKDTIIITNLTSFICVGVLIFDSTSIPVYLYLISKGPVVKTVIIQSSNFLINFLILIFTYKYFGIYSVVLSFLIAKISSFSLAMKFQLRYVNSWIFKSSADFIKLLITICCQLVVDIIILKVTPTPIFKAFSIIIFDGILFFMLVRFLRIYTALDIDRYFYFSKRINNKNTKICIS